jgi:hypothetical protein
LTQARTPWSIGHLSSIIPIWHRSLISTDSFVTISKVRAVEGNPRSLLSTEIICSCEPVPPQPGESVALSRLRLCDGFDPTVLLHYFRSRLWVGSDSDVYDLTILGEELWLYLADEIQVMPIH